MTTARDIQLSPAQRALKLAVADAVSAGGGQVFVSSELNCAQSRVSDWASVNTADFITIDKALRLDALAGSPVIAAAMARQSGGRFVSDESDASDPKPLEIHLPGVAGEMADVVRRLAEQIARREPMSPAARDILTREVKQAIDCLDGLYGDLLLPEPPATGAIPIRRESS